MNGKITVSVTIENGSQPMTIELESRDWSTGGNPRFIAKDFANGVAVLSAKIQAHLAQEFSDYREAAKP